MPGGPDQVSFHTECWDYPEPIVPPVIAGPQKEEPANEKTRAPEGPKAVGRQGGTLHDEPPKGSSGEQ